jgi:hypothetical protein
MVRVVGVLNAENDDDDASTLLVNDGEVANTATPVPVESVSADFKLVELGEPKNVATPVPNPEIPVDTGRLVALVKSTDCGCPNIGATKVGELLNTT